MANSANQLMSVMLFLVLLISLFLDYTVGQIGVNYGRNGAGLPPPSRVVALYQQYGITRMRIYDTDPETIQAVSGSNIELTVGILNDGLQYVAASQANADAWVRDNISKYQNIRFRHIIVGNEVSPINGGTSKYTSFVLPAMQNVYNALNAVNLGGIKVTTQIESEVVDPSTNFPPQNGAFRPEVRDYLNPIVRFLMNTDAPIFVTIYPMIAYTHNPQQIDLRYALLDPTFEGVDGYQNLFYAILDAVNAALEKSAASTASLEAAGTDADKNPPEAKGGESGEDTSGSGPRKLATDGVNNVDNARQYINNLIQAVKKGTPKRPGQPIETYIFAMFDENQKPGDESERHYGLFYADGTPKYPVNFN